MRIGLVPHLVAAIAIGAAAPLAAQQGNTATVPTVVFKAGLGDRGRVWHPVIRQLDGRLPTFTYDRPGYGDTPRTGTPRDPCTIARDLHARLIAEGVAAPYIIAGHSLGGQYAYAFARLFPQDTAGLLLVDATPTGHWDELQGAVPAVAAAFDTLRAITFSGTMKREFTAQDQCLAGRAGGTAAVPTVVLVRTRPEGVEGERLLQLWRARQQSWLLLTGAARLQFVPDTGHYIMRDQPAVVAAALQGLAATRQPASWQTAGQPQPGN